MALNAYKAKRDLSASAEPAASVQEPKVGSLREYCVQMHYAARAGKHIDFRFEHRGVAWSFVLPKATFPQNDNDVRLAIQVEDHPVKYMSWEGTIPPGHYGAGRVALRAHGTLELLEFTEDRIRLKIPDGAFSGTYRFDRSKKRRDHWFCLLEE